MTCTINKALLWVAICRISAAALAWACLALAIGAIVMWLGQAVSCDDPDTEDACEEGRRRKRSTAIVLSATAGGAGLAALLLGAEYLVSVCRHGIHCTRTENESAANDAPSAL